MKCEPTEKFNELGIQKDYQHLSVRNYNKLKSGQSVELENPPEHLLEGGYIIEIEETTNLNENKKE